MNAALFLDRDGVINVDYGYVYKVSDFKFVDGIFELCRHYKEKNFLIFIISNQSGIARGFFEYDDLIILNKWIVEEFSKREIELSEIYCCPHHPDFTGPCSCRKPKPGMILSACKQFDIDLSKSVLIGNNTSDIEAGEAAGVAVNILTVTNDLSITLNDHGLVNI